MITVAAMQPTYLPWLGYFALIDLADVFVVLDDVQFERRSWQQRNRIKGPNGEIMLTVPVRKAPRDALIRNIEINFEHEFPQNHIDNLRFNYARAPHFDDHAEPLLARLEDPQPALADLNLDLIRCIAEAVGIEACYVLSSGARAKGKRDAYLAALCEELDADRYLSPAGSRGYLEGSPAFRQRGIRVEYLSFSHPTYGQLHGRFISHLSAVDALFNVGPRTLDVLRSGYEPPAR